MKYELPKRKALIEIDGKERVFVYAPELYALNRDIFPLGRHGTIKLEERGIFRYSAHGEQVRMVRGGRYYLRVDQLDKVLRDAPDGFVFPTSRDERKNHHAKNQTSPEVLEKLDAIISRLDKLIAIWEGTSGKAVAV